MLRPARFMTASAPSTSLAQSPTERPSQATSRTPSSRAFGERVSTVVESAAGTARTLVTQQTEEARELMQLMAIDISGPEFNFVRSIRVYNVTYASQRESGGELDRECNRHFSMRIGTYGTQGGFYWSRGSSPSQLPEAHVGLERYGEHCPGIFHRSVFVDWRDFEGNYGFEQVNY